MTAAAFVLPLLLLHTAQEKKPVAAIPDLPAGAVKLDEQTYKAKDKDGKTYVYRRTPFGVSKITEEQFIKQNEAALIKPSTESSVKVTDLGSEYKFERAHPFGVQMWKKAKKDLTDDEKAYVEKTLKPAAASSAATKPAAAEKKN